MSEIIKENNDDRLLSFFFNLHPKEHNRLCKGEVVLKKEKLVVIVDEKIENEIDTKDISELVTELGVGCLYISYRLKADDSVHFLCRTDARLSKRAIKTARKMNLYFEDSVLPDAYKDEPEFCPKCGRAYKPG